MNPLLQLMVMCYEDAYQMKYGFTRKDREAVEQLGHANHIDYEGYMMEQLKQYQMQQVSS